MVLYTGNIQFETVIQPLFGNKSYLYKSIVKYLGVPKYYHDRRDTNFLRYFDIFKVKKILLWGLIYTFIKKTKHKNRVHFL